jgi:hypothetical protein
MHMGSDNLQATYILNDEEIQPVNEEKDLGVYTSSDCKPTLQCTKATAKAISSLRGIKRTFNHIDAESFAVLYKAYIRPHLEYCVQAWCPYQKQDIRAMEKVQRRATKLVPKLRKLPYNVRMKELNLYPLEVRRIRGDLIQTFKILKGLEDIDFNQLFVLATNATITRGHKYKLFKTRLEKGLNLRKYFFSQRVIDNWNSLPPNVVEAKTVNQFKNRFDRHLKQSGYGILKGVCL